VTIEGFLYGRPSRIRDMNPSRLIFETAQVTYLDCASARLIAGTGDWLPAGVKPTVMSPSPIVRRVLLAPAASARSVSLSPNGILVRLTQSV
jgi:hypothetical protein